MMNLLRMTFITRGKKAIRTLSPWNPWDGFRIKWRKSYFEFVEIETLMKRNVPGNVETFSDISGGRLKVTSKLLKLLGFFLIKKLLYLSLAQMTDKTYENPHERKPFFIRSSTLVVDVKRAELFVCWKFYERETCVWIVVGRFLLCSNNEKHFLVCDSYNHDYKW